jgi:hypothetical protein
MCRIPEIGCGSLPVPLVRASSVSDPENLHRLEERRSIELLLRRGRCKSAGRQENDAVTTYFLVGSRVRPIARGRFRCPIRSLFAIAAVSRHHLAVELPFVHTWG